MSWFAQNRQSNETPVIVEMVNQTTKELLVQVKGEGVGIKNKKGTNKSSDTKNDLPALERNPLSTSSSSILSSSSPSSPSSVDAYLETTPNILLFCRNQAESPAYVYCGRVQYINHDLSVRPIRFEWRLLDYPSLLQESQTQIHADSSSGNTQAVKLTEKTVKKRERGHTKQDTGDAGDREPKFGLDALFKLKREGD